MSKLTDTQAILLSSASQRIDGNLLPPPETLGVINDRIRKAVGTLIKRDLAQEVAVAKPDHGWRHEGEQHWGAVITDAGRVAIGVEPAQGDGGQREAEIDAGGIAETFMPVEPGTSDPDGENADGPARGAAAPALEPRQTKAALVLRLLRRDGGATLAELVEATGWLPHTTRAALTGLRKKGHELIKGKRDKATCYHVAGEA